MTDLLVPPEADTEDDFTCQCGTVEHVDDTFLVGDDRRCSECATTCDDCGDAVLRDDTVGDGSGIYCDDCRTACPSCDDLFHPDRGVTYRGTTYCTDCYHHCGECGDVVATEDSVTVGWTDSRYCGSCVYYCENCEEYSAGDSCDDGCSSGNIRGLIGYGHTTPSQWLGGPLPRINGHHDGYYLGFELEITASSGDARVVNSWSHMALAVDAFECKEDSSVEGFEIASQPMTRTYIDQEFAPRLPQFFEMLDREFGSPSYNDEPDAHGLHVHISRTAFRDNKGNQSPTMLAAFSRILSADDGTHLEQIGRREQTDYCRKVDKPVSAALATTSEAWSRRRAQRFDAEFQRQLAALNKKNPNDFSNSNFYAAQRLTRELMGDDPNAYARGAVNLQNSATVEIRSFKSTRKPENLLAALRLVSDAADYVRWLVRNRKSLSGATTSWSAFCRWVAVHDPDMFDIVTGLRALD